MLKSFRRNTKLYTCTTAYQVTLHGAEFHSSSSSNILLLCGGLYGEWNERSYNKVLSSAYQVTLHGAEFLETVLPWQDRKFIRALFYPDGAPAEGKGDATVLRVVWDYPEQLFWLRGTDGGQRQSKVTDVSEPSYVSSPYLPGCLREPERPGGADRARSHCRFVLPLIHFIPDL